MSVEQEVEPNLKPLLCLVKKDIAPKSDKNANQQQKTSQVKMHFSTSRIFYHLVFTKCVFKERFKSDHIL